jgi:opacity protein-like surface antigen
MRFKLFVLSILTVSLFAAAFPAFSQVVPAATSGGHWPLSVGIGPSSYDVDWGHGRMYGGTIWVDYYPGMLPSILHGLGVEAEARDISLDRHEDPHQQYPNWSEQANTREDTAGGGVIYTWRHFRNFHPYGKFLISFGSVDFITGLTHATSTYTHDTRTLKAPGLGFEYRIYHQFWARADYEYQDWGTLLGKTLNPQGFTVGVAYNFSHFSHR